MTNATLQVQVTLNKKYSREVSGENKDAICAERAGDVEKIVRAALKAGAFKPCNIRRSKGSDNLTFNTGGLQVVFLTCDKVVDTSDDAPAVDGDALVKALRG